MSLESRAIRCDRCKKWIDDCGALLTGSVVDFTAGYYLMMGDWAKYKQAPDEFQVCDNCMFADPKYIAIYGQHGVAYADKQ